LFGGERMSTSIDYVVDLDSTLDEAPAFAERVVSVLLERGIVLSTPQVHAYLGQGARYATGTNVGEVADHNDCFPCGLDIEMGRAVFTAGENGLDALHCPCCDHRHGPDDLDWASAIGEWYEQRSPGVLSCRSCGREASVAAWRFEPVWGFGNLAFKFSEWLLKEEFVQELSRLLGHRVAWVQSHW
jgi:hypothetical protein